MPNQILNRRQFLARCAAGAGAVVAGRAFAQGADASSLSAAIPDIMQREGVPGLQIAVLRGGQLTDSQSFGVMNVETGAPITGHTLFEAASLTKPVFAYLVLKLAEEGVLGLDAPLHEILPPPAAGPPERIRELTARLTLSHRTGFPNWYRGKDLPMLRPSQGRLFAYSGMAYEYLQHVIEKVTGQPFEALARERLLAPIGMTSATVAPGDADASRMSTPHTREGRPVRTQMAGANAAASLVCTAEDYAKFAVIVARPPAPSSVFLRPESLAEMFTPCVDAGPQIRWGLGWGLQMNGDAPASYFHWGNNYDAFNCFVEVNPISGDGVVVMTNSGNGLLACADIVPMAVSGDHPALRWNRVVQR